VSTCSYTSICPADLEQESFQEAEQHTDHTQHLDRNRFTALHPFQATFFLLFFAFVDDSGDGFD
jgi:hypothetical protein